MNPSDKISLQHHEQVRFVKKREISRLTGLSGVRRQLGSLEMSTNLALKGIAEQQLKPGNKKH